MKKDIDVKEAKECIDNGATVLDVRTDEEYKEEYIQNSVNIDINGGSFKERIKELDKAKSYVVHCVSGGRSAQAVKIMIKLGFENVHNMLGGISEWKKEGFPVMKE